MTNGIAGVTALASGERTPASALAVRCEHVTKHFADGTLGLDDIDLALAAGRITVLLGPSGCGKTTLLRCIAGLEATSSGRIQIGDTTDAPAPSGHARPDVAMVFQNYALYPSKSVYGNIEFPLRMARVPRRERRERVLHTAKLLRIEDLLKREVGQLSGGQRQRVGIGRALVRRPAVLLMDEPLSNLDAEMRVAMRSELHTLQRRLGATLVFVTHDQTEALALADTLVVMRSGRIEQAGGAEEVFSEPATTFVASFLGAMNILGGTSLGGQFQVNGSPVHFNLGHLRTADVHSIGIRPEDLRIGPGGADSITLSGPTTLTELLGRERLVHFRVGANIIRAKVHVSDVIGSTFTCHASAGDLHPFDSSGRREPDPEAGVFETPFRNPSRNLAI